jgi:hypothetical protein
VNREREREQFGIASSLFLRARRGRAEVVAKKEMRKEWG